MQSESSGHSKVRQAGLALAALGVVYGDIGTSPLYAFRECFHSGHAVPVSPANVLGVLSLLIWSLILIVTIKYLVFVMRADNKGEGGILALLALAFPEQNRTLVHARGTAVMIGAGLFGAALLYGDGMITPAVSILGALEGLDVATPAFSHWIVPLAVVILAGLFAAQRAGTASVGRIFGPIMIVWFITIAVLGVRGMVTHLEVVGALNPSYAVMFLYANGWMGFKVLASVFLVVTGGEALYADMGHFGKSPIRYAWFVMVLPSLLLNYFGQAAVVLENPDLAANPFFYLAPRWGLYPLTVLAVLAAVIASQALISGAFSMTMQGIQLGYIPRLVIEHTSERERGQIYLPHVNWALMVACLGLVLGFRTSSELAAAYGIAVTLTMIITTLLFHVVARRRWGWTVWQSGLICVPALVIEFSFFTANALKIKDGGWFPLAIGAALFTAMTTWKRGRQLVWERIRSSAMPLDKFIVDMERRSPPRVSGTAVYMASNSEGTPLALLHNLKHNKVLHKRVVLLTIMVDESPRVPDAGRVEVEKLDAGFWRVRSRYGFFEEPDVRSVLRRCAEHELEFKEMETTFFLSRETVLASSKPGGMMGWRKRLFSVLSRNSTSATAYFRLPANRVVELGMQVEI